MGYGVWNASGLDPDSDPKTLHFDYAYTSEDDFKDMQADGEVGEDDDFERFSQDERDDEVLNWASTICAAGNHLKDLGADVTTFSRKDETLAWSYHGDRYQYLKAAFYVGKAGVWWQQEPFMGGEMVVAIAPQYHLDEEHPVWTMDEADFRREMGLSIDRYKEVAEKHAADLVEFVLAYMEDQMSAVSNRSAWCGSGYVGHHFELKDIKSLKKTTSKVLTWGLSHENRERIKQERMEKREQKAREQQLAHAEKLRQQAMPHLQKLPRLM